MHDLERRAFLAGSLSLALAGPALAAPAWPANGRLAFDVFRKGRKIGQHALTFTGDRDALTMRARVDMAVGLGPVVFFRYHHEQVERWTGGRFDTIEANTLQNGEKIHVVARRTDTGVMVEGGKGGPRKLAAAALPLTHWNRASLDGPLFNPQDGMLMRLSIVRQGPSPVRLASGAMAPARCIALGGETSIEDWYDHADCWTGLRAKAKDGSIVEYRRT